MKLRISRTRIPQNKRQLDLNLARPFELDRNSHLGGKSFYFFDFDDNVVSLATPIVLFSKKDNSEKWVSSGSFAQHSKSIGKDGPFKDYFLNFDDDTGSFRNFRDQKINIFERLLGKQLSFHEDIQVALKRADYSWKAPSWHCFYHATYNQRPTSVITARGHQKETIKRGIDLLVKDGHLPHNPNYLTIYPVSNSTVRATELDDPKFQISVPELKRRAIIQSVETALQTYGHSPHHRFGMSDDDPANLELITEAMKELKREYVDMSFFVIQTTEDAIIKTEVLQHRTKQRHRFTKPEQLNLL